MGATVTASTKIQELAENLGTSHREKTTKVFRDVPLLELLLVHYGL